jgi:membrane protein DedA with SNARE-associated domain
MDIPSLLQHYGYVAVAIGAFLEGEAILLVAGAAAYSGYLMLPNVILVGAIASFFGNQLYFALGRRYGPALLRRRPTLQMRTRRVNALLERYHLPLILALQFLYGLRIAGALAVGMSDVPWLRFLILNLIGAFGWALCVTASGYGFGRVLAYMQQYVDVDIAWRVLALMTAGAVAWIFLRRRSDRADAR